MPAAKRRGLAELGGSSSSNHELLAYAGALFPAEQIDLTRPFVADVLATLPGWWRTHSPWLAGQLTRVAFPAVHVEDATVRAVDSLLATELDPGLRHALTGQRSELAQALVARRLDGDGRR